MDILDKLEIKKLYVIISRKHRKSKAIKSKLKCIGLSKLKKNDPLSNLPNLSSNYRILIENRDNLEEEDGDDDDDDDEENSSESDSESLS